MSELRGKTALVTGASSGIGRALALRLAEGGTHVVLVARDEAALDKVATEIAARFQGVKTHVMVKDLTRTSAAVELYAATQRLGLEIDIVVNNAGFAVHGPFETTSLEREAEMVDVQIGCFLGLTKLYLPRMLARGRGWFLNVASVYSFVPVPFQAVYGSCKAFMYSFSEALANETASQGITISVCCPGTTKTEFRSRAGKPEKGKGLSAEAVAEVAYAGLVRGKRLTVPGGINKFFVTLVRILPGGWLAMLMRVINHFRLRK